jgi:hypothetical protein
MTEKEERETPLDDDERTRRAAAEELQKQIDALVRGDAGPQPDRPRSLRDYFEHDRNRPLPKSSEAGEASPDQSGGRDSTNPERPPSAEKSGEG